MSMHYWPTEPGRYLLEKSSGEVHFSTLCENGTWQGDCYLNAFVRDLTKKGYLGVRTPFSEEAERAAFEAVFPVPSDEEWWDGGREKYRLRWDAWLAAVRHERGL